MIKYTVIAVLYNTRGMQKLLLIFLNVGYMKQIVWQIVAVFAWRAILCQLPLVGSDILPMGRISGILLLMLP